MAFLSTPLDTFHSTPPVTRAFVLLLVLCSLGYQYLSYQAGGGSPDVPYLLLVPGSWIWYPWTIITSSLFELNIVELIVSVIFMGPALRYLERLWGALETVKFVVVVCGVSNVISLVINYVEYTVLGMPEIFLAMKYHGLMALQAACLVAFTQQIPEHQVQLFGLIKLRVKQLPMLYVGFSNVMCIIGYQSPYILIQWGWLVSWIYLRFYKKTSIEGVTLASGTETWGDRSETFAFIYWFPPFVHGPLSKVCDFVYNSAVSVKVVRPYPSMDLEAGGYAGIPGGNNRAEAERRRAMALKALDQRMATANSGAANPAKASRPEGTSVAGPDQSSQLQSSGAP